jgi:hypothetical protein
VHNTAGEPATEVNGSVQRDTENPNIEAEGGETILDPNVGGLPAHFNINGPSHAEGGVPMRATEDSFIFSKFLKMPKDISEYFGFTSPKKGKSKTSKHSFADAAKKHGGVINHAREVMADPRSTKQDIATAELNIKNAIDKLGQISLAQEASKGYEDGIPALAMPYLMRVGADPDALLPMADQEQMEQAPDDEMAEGEMPQARYGGDLPMAQRGRNRRMQRRINDLRRAQTQPRIVTDRNTGMTYVVDAYGNIINTPFSQQQPATSRTTVTKFKPAEGAVVITRNENESDVDFQKRLKDEFAKAKNKEQVYTIKPDGGYQRVTKTSVAKKLPDTYTSDDRLGGFNNDYYDLESIFKDPANNGIVDRVHEEYLKQINTSTRLSAARKAELKKKSPEEVLENFLKAQKQVFAITKAEVDGKITPITKDETWDKGTKNKVYKETLKKLGFKDDEIFSEDQIAMFQAAYKGVQAAADDPAYKTTLERFTLQPRGMNDDMDYKGRSISPIDDIFGNTTAGQGLFVKNPKEDGIGFEDIEDKTATETTPGSPTYTRNNHELEYLGPDVTNMAANLMIGANQPNVMPASFPMAPVDFNQAYLDPSREVAETQGTAQGALRAAGIYGSPQGYASAAASTQGQAANQIANTLGKYFNANNEIYNNSEKARADLAFKTNAYNLENASNYYDKITQKIQNDKQQQNEFIAQTAQLKNAMDVNAAGVYNIEEMAGDRFRIDKPTMTTYFNKGKQLTGQEQFDEHEAKIARMQELMKRGVSADKAAQIIFGGKGVDVQDPGDQEAAMFNEMIQRYNMGDPQASAMMQQYAQAAGTGAQGYMFGGLI